MKKPKETFTIVADGPFFELHFTVSGNTACCKKLKQLLSLHQLHVDTVLPKPMKKDYPGIETYTYYRHYVYPDYEKAINKWRDERGNLKRLKVTITQN